MHKLNTALVLTFLFSGISLIAQHALVPYRQGDKWGFSKISGEVVVVPIYDKVDLFTKDIAKVYANGKTGIINIYGSNIVNVAYDQIEPINNVYFITRQNGKFGIMRAYNDTISTCIYEQIKSIGYPYYEAVKNGKSGIFKAYDSEFTEIIPVAYLHIRYDKNSNRFYATDTQGKEHEYDTFGYEQQVKTDDDTNTESVILNHTELSTATPLQHISSNPLKPKEDKPYYPVSRNYEDQQEQTDQPEVHKSERINYKTGKKPKNDSIHLAEMDYVDNTFRFDNVYLVKQDNKWGACDKDGRILVPIIYDSISKNAAILKKYYAAPFTQVFAVKKGKNWGALANVFDQTTIKTFNAIVLPFQFQSIEMKEYLYFISAKKKGLWYLYNPQNFQLVNQEGFSSITQKKLMIDNYQLVLVKNIAGKDFYVGENGFIFYTEK